MKLTFLIHLDIDQEKLKAAAPGLDATDRREYVRDDIEGLIEHERQGDYVTEIMVTEVPEPKPSRREIEAMKIVRGYLRQVGKHPTTRSIDEIVKLDDRARALIAGKQW